MGIKYRLNKILSKAFIILIILELVLQASIFLYLFYFKYIFSRRREVDMEAYRIICVGESTTYGGGASPKESYPKRLEEILQRRYSHKRFQIFNLGVVGITLPQIYRYYYRDILYFRPNLIILQVGNNVLHPWDLGFCSIFNFQKLKFVKLVYFGINFLKMTKQEQSRNKERKHLVYFYSPFAWEFWSRRGYDKAGDISKLYLEEMLKIARKNNSNVLICNYFGSWANEFLRESVKENRIAFCNIELRMGADKLAKCGLVSGDGWHPNAKGHLFIAKAIFRTILKYNLI